MVLAIGIDIVEIARIDEVITRRGDRFRRRVFTQAEIEYCERRTPSSPSYAARFAAKEAAMKALGTGWAGGVRWRDIEVVVADTGTLSVRLTGKALEVFETMGASRALVSVSHSRDLAAATVVLEG